MTASLYAILLVVLLLPAWGCDGPTMAETDQFEAAEVYYRAGDYEEALDGYQAFLRHYPQSPLAEVAEQRIRTINREVSSMLGRSDMPRPVYRKGDSAPTEKAGSVKSAESETSAETDEGE
jgi:hypothetical protein